MPFIGIISEKKNENEFEKSLKEIFEKKDMNVVIIKINEKSIDNIKNIKFNAILINNTNSALKNKKIFYKIILSARYLIINSDVDEILKNISSIEKVVISYGFNNKATITASSVSDDEMMICIQREFENIYGKKIELQEVIAKNSVINESMLLGIASICLLY